MATPTEEAAPAPGTEADTAEPTDTETESPTETPTPQPLQPAAYEQTAGAYPTAYGNQERSGDATHVHGPASQPTHAWSYEVGHHPWTPLVCEGTVFASLGGWRRGEPNFFAVDQTTGEEQWGVDIGNAANRAAAVMQTHLLVPCWRGQLTAVDRQRGTVRWRTQVGNGDLFTPAVGNGVAVVTSEEGCFGVDPVDGTIQWHYETDRSTMSSATVGNGGWLANETAFFHALDGDGARYLHAVDTQTGNRVWRRQGTVAYNRAPAYRSGRLYLSGPNGTEARRADDGELVWSAQAGAETTPAVTADAVYVRTDDTLVAFDRESGDELWSTGVGSLSFRRGVPGPTVTENVVIVPDRGGGDVTGVDRDDGTTLWSVTQQHPVTRTVAVVEGTLVTQGHIDSSTELLAAYTW